jgi:ankyrin repeat protein
MSSDEQCTIFGRAVEINYVKKIESMLTSGSIDPNARLPLLNAPPLLVHTVGRGKIDIVKLLLNAGARIDDVDKAGRSACHAAAYGRVEMMRLLLNHQPKPNLALKSSDGLTALQIAIGNLFPGDGSDKERSEFVTLIARAGAPLDNLSRVEMCRFAAVSVDTIQALMDRDVDFSDLRDDFLQTPLHVAARNRADLGVLRKLIDCGVDIEALDRQYYTCSWLAITQTHLDALRLFLQAGADVNGGAFLLHTSVLWKLLPFAILLLAAGADVSARDGRGRTPCQLSAVKSQPIMSFVHAMLAGGADLDTADANGNTTRQWLAACGETVDAEQVEAMRRDIAKTRLDFVRNRAMQVCIGLQPLQLDALQLCEILPLACGPLARVIAFHQWWKIATTVKHFKQ